MAAKTSASGQRYQSREAAATAFRQKHAADYPTKFSAKPSTRPTYIPQTYTTSNGRSVSVIYDSSHGGYGYYVGNRWSWYDPLVDAAIVSTLMSSRGYYYDDYGRQRAYYDGTPATHVQMATPATRNPQTTFADYYPQRRRRRIGFGAVLLIGFFVVGAIIVFANIAQASARRDY